MSRQHLETVPVCQEDSDRLVRLGLRYMEEGFDSRLELPKDGDIRFAQASACMELGVVVLRLGIEHPTEEVTPIRWLSMGIRQRWLICDARRYEDTGRPSLVSANQWRYPTLRSRA